MKNILLFTPFINRGSIRCMTEGIARGLEQVAPFRNWKIDVLGQQYDEVGTLINYPASFHFTPIEPLKRLPRHPHLINFLRENAKVFVDHLRRVAPDYDLIFCPNAFWSTAAEWDIATPLIALIPDIGWDLVEMGDFLAMYLSESTCRIAESAAFTVFTGETHRQLALSRYGFSQDKTTTIPNSADLYAPPLVDSTRKIRQVRINYNLPDRYILLPDAIGFHGIDAGLLAYAQARSRQSDLPPLVLAGFDIETVRDATTPYGARLHELIVTHLELNLGQDVLIAGTVAPEDRVGLFAGAGLTLIPSRMEGDLSGALFEALQARSPIIFSDLPVFTDRLGKDNQYGLVFPVDDVQALSDRILEVMNDPVAASERTAAAFVWAQQYRLPQVVDRYASLFDRALAQPANSSDERSVLL